MIPEDSVKPVLAKPSGLGMRHVLTFLGFWGFAMSYAMRFNLSIAIVAMVRHHGSNGTVPEPSTNLSNILGSFDLVPGIPHALTIASFGENETKGELSLPLPVSLSLPPACPSPTSSMLSSSPPSAFGVLSDSDEGEFDWDEKEQGIILGSFFWGYMATQLLGGLLAQRFGGKWVLGLGLFVTALVALLTPIAARTHVYLLIAARVIQGLGEGVTTPAMHMLLSKWIPPEERGTLTSITYSGSSFGTAATMIVSGYLIQANVLGGWPSVFYVIGGLTLVWFVLWCALVSDSPAEHPRISGDELYYIQRSIGNQLSKVKLPTPWRKMAMSGPLWVIIIAHTGHTWGLYTLLTELPTYLKTILNFDIKQNSFVSALPYALMCFTGFLIPSVADSCIKRKWVSTLTVRKTCQVISHVGGALALIGASYSGCNAVVTVLFLTIAGGANGAAFGGFGVNHIDIASNHAGILMGITNTVANISGFLGPYVAGVLINGHATLDRWQIVFYIAAAIYAVDTLVFLFFASAEEQSWNRSEESAFYPPLLDNQEGPSGSNASNVRNSNPETARNKGNKQLSEEVATGSENRGYFYEDDFGLGSSGIIAV